MQVTQCDNTGCRKLGPVPPVGWIILGQVADLVPSSAWSAILSQREPHTVEGAFCSWACVVEFAYLKSIEDVSAAADPAPEGGEAP